MERIVSMSSNAAAMGEYAAAKYKPEEWQNRNRWLTGDMNTSIIKTAKGRTVMMQMDASTPRPYSRINLLQGSKGCFYDYPPRLALAELPGDEAKWLSGKDYEKARRDDLTGIKNKTAYGEFESKLTILLFLELDFVA